MFKFPFESRVHITAHETNQAATQIIITHIEQYRRLARSGRFDKTIVRGVVIIEEKGVGCTFWPIPGEMSRARTLWIFWIAQIWDDGSFLFYTYFYHRKLIELWLTSFIDRIERTGHRYCLFQRLVDMSHVCINGTFTKNEKLSSKGQVYEANT